MICRGSTGEGLGHLYRAASFAAHAERQHEVEIVAVADNALRRIFAGLSCPLHLVREDRDVLSILAAFRPDAVAFDLTRLNAAVFTAAARAGLTVSLSPVFEHMAGVDALFTRGQPPAGLIGPRIFSGLAYALFNVNCTRISDAQFEANLSNPSLAVALNIGGGDAENLTLAALDVLLEVEQPCVIWTMLGDAYNHSYDDLIAKARRRARHEIILARTNRSMWQLLGNAVVGVLSSGLSTLEAVYAGLPTISVVRENDPANEVRTAYDQCFLDGGAFNDGSFKRLPHLIEQLHRDRDELRRLRRLQRDLVDNRGALRILEGMQALLEAPVQVEAERETAKDAAAPGPPSRLTGPERLIAG